MKKIILLLGLYVLSCQFAWSESGKRTALKVCADPYNLPYSNKKQEGFENKIAELFAKELGLPLKYEWFPQRMGFIRNTLKKKVGEEERFKCDYVMGVPTGYELTLTTNPYYHSTYALVVSVNS